MERAHYNTPKFEGHLFRYHLASGFSSAADVVLDAACGTGYGYTILRKACAHYVGVDKFRSEYVPGYEGLGARFLQADLNSWNPDFGFDVFVGFETVEHLSNPEHYLGVARGARKWALLSVPVVPTVGINPYHLRDYVRGELPRAFIREGWTLFQTLDQPSEMSEIYVFKKTAG